ncbi:penicillin acylase family protein [Tsuneonella sp. HG094]
MNTAKLLAGIAFTAMAVGALPAQAASRPKATITRTTFGIPHIKAKDFAGLGFGGAYAQAQDNICLLADAYLTAAGERSKFLGADQPTQIAVWPAKNVDSDVFYRTVVTDERLQADFARLSPEGRQLIDGFVAGYNRFLVDNAGKLPKECAGQAWVRPITRNNLLRWINGFALFASSSGLATQIATAAPPRATKTSANDISTAVPSPFADSPLRLGSNGWAFGGDATTNGRGLVVANPHFPWAGPYRFYEIQQTIPGKFDVAGATIMGQPYVGIGFNRDVAWTHTVDTAVHMTLARLKLDPTDPTAYLVDGQREAMTRRDLTIETKDGAPVTRTVYSTRYGPVASLPGSPYAWTGERAYAVMDANAGNIRGADTYIGMGRAKTVADVRSALIHHMGAGFVNTIAADRSGNAMFADITPAPNLPAEKFASCGAIGPKLPTLYAPLYEIDGSRSECAWTKAAGTPVPGLLPGAEMTTQVRRDYVQNSNDSYRWTNPALPPVERGPMLGVDPGQLPDMRTRSGIEEIEAVLKSGKFDIGTAAQTMLGNKVFVARFVKPATAEVCARPAAPADACAAIAAWDGKSELDSRGALLATFFWSMVGKRPNIWKVPFDPANVVGTPAEFVTEGAAGDALLADLTMASSLLKSFGIPLDAPLGEIQFAQRGEERIPISGANWGVLNNMGGVPVPGGINVIFGSSYIQSVTWDDRGPVADAVLTFSQSTDPASPHFADQTRAFSQKKLRRFPFSQAEIAADTIGTPIKVGN